MAPVSSGGRAVVPDPALDPSAPQCPARTKESPVSILAAAVPAEYEAPGVSDFWQPLIGSGSTAITRACFVAAISVVVILWFLLATTKKKALVPSKGQMATEAVYGLVRNGVARDLIGSKDFLRFVPLLFSLVHVHPGEQPLRRDPADPVPDDEPDRVPHRAGAHRRAITSTTSWDSAKHGFIGYWKSLVPSGLPGWHGRPDLLPRADHRPLHPAADPGPAALRQHVRRPHPHRPVHHRRRVHADERRHPAAGRRRR